jgi:hypothetical protein
MENKETEEILRLDGIQLHFNCSYHSALKIYNYLELNLRKQAEVIAEKATIELKQYGMEIFKVVDKQSILTASENFIKNIK